MQVGKVDASQFEHVYENFLKAENIDLVICCNELFHKIIFDTRVDDNGNVLKINSEVLCLWLNSKHYDVITNPEKFSGNFGSCFRCMRKLSDNEFRFNPVCRTDYTCKKRYSSIVKSKGDDRLHCSKCNVIFANDKCFTNHLLNKIFASTKKNVKLTSCDYFMFCQTCYKTVPRFFFLASRPDRRYHYRDCEKTFCQKCRVYEKDHLCYMKPYTGARESNMTQLQLYLMILRLARMRRVR